MMMMKTMMMKTLQLDQTRVRRPKGEELKIISLLKSILHKETLKGKTPSNGSKLTLNPEWFKQPLRPPTPDPEWNKRQVVIELLLLITSSTMIQYLKTFDLEVTYTTSITKTKAARYEIKGIKDMVPTLWSTIKYAYDKDALIGIKHWGERRKNCGYRYQRDCVKISDQQLYKFKKGDFVDLHLNEIEDMIFLVVKHKLFHLDGSDIVDFIMALRMFTRSLILKRRVEDLQGLV
ncbi:hypothetical protein Tco_0269721 [Tanacetum coccineum]